MSFEVLHAFVHSQGGYWPGGTLVSDGQGTLYGTTTAAHQPGGQHMPGVLFKLQGKTLTTLRYFEGGPNDGAEPFGTLALDKTGVLYGTTRRGGAADRGTVFRYDQTQGLQLLHSFTGLGEGALPQGGLVRDAATGVLFGTTEFGGDTNCGDGEVAGCGTVFKIDAAAPALTTVHAFTAGEGLYPTAAPTLAGTRVWTTTPHDSSREVYAGAPVSMKKNGKAFVRTPTISVEGSASGFNSGLTADGAGNLYGVAYTTTPSNMSPQGGAIYRIDANGQYGLVYSFPLDGTKGAFPNGTLVKDSAGMLYGVTRFGGSYNGKSDGGTVFKFDPATQTLQTLHSFPACDAMGCDPISLTIDRKGVLYGMTRAGGNGQYGVIFRIKQ